MKLIIGGKPYELEYSFNAAQYDDCVEQLFNYVGATVDGAIQRSSGSVFKTLSGTPNLVITLFYAGLMEKNPVGSREEAAALLKQYFYENKGKKEANFGGMFTEINKQMETDGFFGLIGLDNAMMQMEEAAKKQMQKVTKIPTDHQKPKASQK